MLILLDNPYFKKVYALLSKIFGITFFLWALIRFLVIYLLSSAVASVVYNQVVFEHGIPKYVSLQQKTILGWSNKIALGIFIIGIGIYLLEELRE